VERILEVFLPTDKEVEADVSEVGGEGVAENVTNKGGGDETALFEMKDTSREGNHGRRSERKGAEGKD